MRILEAKFTNFKAFSVCMRKRVVYLDLSKDTELLQVFQGKMGSGKTFLLSLLSPFSTLGTLDVRNGESLIIEGEDGEKIIAFQSGKDIFVCKHVYLWKKDTHVKKSFFMMNGEELNSNGNATSFLELVERYLGISPSYMTLLRLGSNVKNLIEMGYVERKTYISELLKETEFYNLFHKIIKEENKLINSKISMLSQKLSDLSSDRNDDFKTALHKNNKLIESLNREKNSLMQCIYTDKAKIESIVGNKSFDDYSALLEVNEKEVENIILSIEDLEKKISSIDTSYTSESLNLKIMELTGKRNGYKDSNMVLEAQYESANKELIKLQEKQLAMNNSSQIDSLKSTYDSLMGNLLDYENDLKGFECPYNTTAIKGIMGEVATLCAMLLDVLEYGSDSIKRIYNSDSSIIKWADKKIEKLNKQKFFLQNEITNLEYANHYKSGIPMYIPPFCGDHKSCPYYKTHPCRLKAQEEKDKKEMVTNIKNKISVCDAEIEMYMSYPLIYNKLSVLKKLWGELIPKLKKLKVCRNGDLYQVLMLAHTREFYDVEKLNEYLEKCTKREKYYQLTERINGMKAELESLSMYDNEGIEKQIQFYKQRVDESRETLKNNEFEILSLNKKIEVLNENFILISEADEINKKITKLKETKAELEDKILEMKSNLMLIQEANSNMVANKDKVNNLNIQIDELTSKNEKIKTVLNDIEYTTDEFVAASQTQTWIKAMMDSTSSKEGIPLVFVSLFMNECKESCNTMLQEVFTDEIEIQDFIIKENKFEIPYTKNGVLINDVKYMSQGEKSILNICLAFAIMERQIKEGLYNIPLLDEVDGPLYKDDRVKFFSILFNYCQRNNIEQCFLISHNNMAEGFPCNIILTSDEVVESSVNKVYRL